MAHVTTSLEIDQGANGSLRIIWLQDSGDPVLLATDKWCARIMGRESHSERVLFDFSSADGDIALNDNGYIDWSLSYEQAQKLNFDMGRWQLEMSRSAAGPIEAAVISLMAGPVALIKETVY